MTKEAGLYAYSASVVRDGHRETQFGLVFDHDGAGEAGVIGGLYADLRARYPGAEGWTPPDIGLGRVGNEDMAMRAYVADRCGAAAHILGELRNQIMELPSSATPHLKGLLETLADAEAALPRHEPEPTTSPREPAPQGT